MTVEIITKSLTRCIDMEWLTRNPHMRLEAIAQEIVDDLNKEEQQQKKNRAISLMFETMAQYFPNKLDTFLNEKEQNA